ncbi:hypothetical protein C6Q18_23250 [Pseudomonas chlororaphis subsp. piscium]|nr:hypothetical protein C6Q18_23250 [Pseudomonas chlororaphis subsp. piscium]SDS48282.1 hypothetical protein SAMN05216585_2419 [Pseudomonas chlororaphis]
MGSTADKATGLANAAVGNIRQVSGLIRRLALQHDGHPRMAVFMAVTAPNETKGFKVAKLG